MAFGNRLGVKLCSGVSKEEAFAPAYGSILAEVSEEALATLDAAGIAYRKVGRVTDTGSIVWPLHSCKDGNCEATEAMMIKSSF